MASPRSFTFRWDLFDPPGTVYVPGLTQDLYGKFTVNLGVYVPEVAEYQGGDWPARSCMNINAAFVPDSAVWDRMALRLGGS